MPEMVKPLQTTKPERTFLLSRFKDGVEETVGDDKDEVMDIVMHYRHLVSMRIKTRANSLPMSHFAGQIGSILFHFFPEFPDSELPLAGGISDFEFRGYEFRFDTEGARAVETINVADHLHSLMLCKPYLCIEPSCVNYSVAVDDRMILPPEATFFLRLSAKYKNIEKGTENQCIEDANPEQSELFLRNYETGEEFRCNMCDVLRISPGEYLISRGGINPSLCAAHGVIYDYMDTLWEFMPAPTDASQLDMHLAQMSSLDTRYVLLFTSDVKHLFDDTMHRNYDELDDDSEESDNEAAYVESALVPGLQQRDFNRVIDTELALSGLTLDDDTRNRMQEILAS